MASLVALVQTYFCPNSTDGGDAAANHYVKEGACVICDRSTAALAAMHGLS